MSLNLNELHLFTSVKYNYYQTGLTSVNFLLKTIFNYHWFISLEINSDWNAYKLTEALGINVCPYCNRQRTFVVKSGNNKITRPELDHFLPKSEHPILALSFYNLIPSCNVCNRDLKGEISFSYETHLSPYEKNSKHELMKFDYRPLSYEGAAGISEEIKINVIPDNGLDAQLRRKVEGNINTFKYDAINENLKDTVQEIIYKRYISDDDYIQILKQTFPKINLSESEAYKLAYGNFFDERDFAKRPLSKMTKDIAHNVGALKKHE